MKQIESSRMSWILVGRDQPARRSRPAQPLRRMVRRRDGVDLSELRSGRRLAAAVARAALAEQATPRYVRPCMNRPFRLRRRRQRLTVNRCRSRTSDSRRRRTGRPMNDTRPSRHSGKRRRQFTNNPRNHPHFLLPRNGVRTTTAFANQRGTLACTPKVFNSKAQGRRSAGAPWVKKTNDNQTPTGFHASSA